VGEGPLNRMYQAADGWFFMAAREDQVDALKSAIGLKNAGTAERTNLEELLEGRFLTDSVGTWVGRLLQAGVGAHALVTDAQALMTDPWVEAHGLSLTRDHEGIGVATTTGPAPRLSRTPVVAGNPASVPGADEEAILRELEPVRPTMRS
ncbi:MAG TPA: CoA transferase, partial [Dehalococcoidia bacterium]